MKKIWIASLVILLAFSGCATWQTHDAWRNYDVDKARCTQLAQSRERAYMEEGGVCCPFALFLSTPTYDNAFDGCMRAAGWEKTR